MAKSSPEPSPADAPRIVVLAGEDPASDPRVLWVAGLCQELARTDVIGVVYATERPWKEYDGRLFVERVLIREIADYWTLVQEQNACRWLVRGGARRFIAQQRTRLAESFTPMGGPTEAAPAPSWWKRLLGAPKRWAKVVDSLVGAYSRYRALRGFREVLSRTLCQVARSLSVPPRLAICNDFVSLAAGVWLKHRHGTRVVYESHECYPEADLLSPAWEMRAWERQERPLIQQVDLVVTVTPPLEEHLRARYHLTNTLSVPNACPLEPEPAAERAADGRVRFLYQGGAAPGRGLEMLLDTWNRWGDVRTVLGLRCPDHEYVQGLRTRFRGAVERGLIEFLPAVTESELVRAATWGEVGLIPYPPHNRNHQYCGPNKLGQYLQARLAVLAARSDFLAPFLERWQCGLSYEGFSGQSLMEQARRLVEEPGLLQAMRRQARAAAEQEFQWDKVAAGYRDKLRDLLGMAVGEQWQEPRDSRTRPAA